ncbi:MAG: hypothetical protein ACRDGT_03130 [Candidatus Limnocylindria bacterium]
MSDRDRDLTGLFVRDIDQIDLPPRAAWRPAARKERWAVSVLRPLAFATGAAVLLVVALVAGMSLRERGAPATSPSPTAATAPPSPTGTPEGATATPASSAPASATPSRAEVLDGRFGFVWGPYNRTVVRSETSEAEVSSVPREDLAFTSLARIVSPDGRFLAYWNPVREGAVLHVRPVAGGSARAVLTSAPGMSGGSFAWSSDGTGLVVAIDNNCQEFCPSVAELWTVDLASGTTEKVATGKFWLPLRWDRASQLVAAGVTGPGGYLTGYDLIDLETKPYAVRSTEFRPTILGRLEASGDARYVLLVSDGIPSTSLSWWPLAEPEKRSAIEFDGMAARWRPVTSEMWWVGGLTPPGCRARPCAGTQLVRFDVATGTRTVVHRGEYGAALDAFRTDGTAAITASFVGEPGSNATDLTFVDIGTGRTASLRLEGVFWEPVRLE